MPRRIRIVPARKPLYPSMEGCFKWQEPRLRTVRCPATVSSVRRTLLVLAAVAFLGLLPTGALAHLGSIAPPVDVSTAILRAGPPAATPGALVLGLAAGLL